MLAVTQWFSSLEHPAHPGWYEVQPKADSRYFCPFKEVATGMAYYLPPRPAAGNGERDEGGWLVVWHPGPGEWIYANIEITEWRGCVEPQSVAHPNVKVIAGFIHSRDAFGPKRNAFA